MLRMDHWRRQHWSPQSWAHSSHGQVSNSQSATTAFANPIEGCSIQPLERFMALIDQLEVHVDTLVDDLRAHIDTCVNEFYDWCKHMDECLTIVESWVSTQCNPSSKPVHQNNIFEAWKVFNSMQEMSIWATWKSYSVFIKELCKISKTDAVTKVLNEIQASKIIIGDEEFNWVISYLENKGETEMVKK